MSLSVGQPGQYDRWEYDRYVADWTEFELTIPSRQHWAMTVWLVVSVLLHFEGGQHHQHDHREDRGRQAPRPAPDRAGDVRLLY